VLSIALLITLLAGSGVHAQTQTPAPMDPVLAAKLQARVDRWLATHGAPGVAAAVRLPDGAWWVGTAGYRIAGSTRRVLPGTPFAIASLTKTFVAALVLKLQEEGRIHIDQPISTWLPGWPRAKRITVRMLLQHESGIYDYFANPRYESLVFDRPRHRWRVGEILALAGPSYCLPGACFHYSNTNYVLLGRIIKKVTGVSVAQNLRQRFIDPLGLRDTYFQGQELIGKVPAKGYLATAGGFRGFADGSRFRPNTSAATVANAAGALVSSVRDVSTWQDALLSGGLLAPESLAMMMDFDRRSGYGLGLRYARLDGILGIGHGGSLRGYVSLMYRLHKQDIDVVVMTNLGRTNIQGLVDRLTRASMRHYGIPRPAPLEPEPEVTPQPTPSPGTPLPADL
jgi:D-alanyl-D-alanine carboxypeptidase